jgi:Subtilase family
MPERDYPLLLFPTPTTADRNNRGGRGVAFARPSGARQGIRLTPKFAALQAAFEAARLRLQQAAPAENPEFVVVFETIGTVENFTKAVAKIPGLEWLLESALEQVTPDEDFFVEGKEEKTLSGRLFLLGTNQQALTEILSLWERYKNEPASKFARGLAPWKHIFEQLKDVRRWSHQDRIGADIRTYWQEEVAAGPQTVRFEIDAWCYRSPERNEEARARIQALVQGVGGQVLSRTLIPEIVYHGFLVDLPTPLIESVLAGNQPELVLSDRIMYFRPRAQSIVAPQFPEQAMAFPPIAGEVGGDPVVALLDGFPLQNHALLAGRLVIDDPDGWEATYEAKDRVHGTAMASLVVHGELDSPPQPLDRPIYVRPVLRPDAADVRPRRAERTPSDILLIDLVHRAVKRICEGEADLPPMAPSVRIINLSIGDESRVFERDLSPWARLLDWLAFKYQILFVVSTGNCDGGLQLAIPRNTLVGLTSVDRGKLALKALLASDVDRRLIAPAEAINVLTTGAGHFDSSKFPPVPERFDLFDGSGLSPYSRIGHGFRRAVKPDILMPGGRILHRERPVGPPDVTSVETIAVPAAPGHRVASPPAQGLPDATEYCRGTSNSAALASRAAAQTFKVIDALRAAQPEALPPHLDAVLIKALVVHGASWGEAAARLLDLRPDLTDWRVQREFVARWLGYGPSDVDRALACTDQRATLVGVGQVGQDQARVFEVPLPPSLSAKAVSRRMVVTLAWLSPTKPSQQAYRSARLWISPPRDELRVVRTECVHDHAQRGTLQHEVLEGEDAVAFVDGARIQLKVNCAADAGDFEGEIPFALCLSLEVPVETAIPIYQEIRTRVAPAVPIQPAT